MVAVGTLIVIVAMGACSDARPSQVSLEAESSSEGLPERLRATLARDATYVEDGSFDEGISSAATMSSFAKLYKPDAFDEDPDVYAVAIRSSDVTVLTPGLAARVVHVAGVERTRHAPPRPSQEQSSESPEDVVVTDMFAFFDAESGEHLVTSYIGPDGP